MPIPMDAMKHTSHLPSSFFLLFFKKKQKTFRCVEVHKSHILNILAWLTVGITRIGYPFYRFYGSTLVPGLLV